MTHEPCILLCILCLLRSVKAVSHAAHSWAEQAVQTLNGQCTPGGGNPAATVRCGISGVHTGVLK